MGVLGNIAYFLIDTLFGLYIGLIMVRFLLGLVRADFYNPFSQFVVTVTNPLLRPLRRLIPAVAGIDTAAIVLMFGLKLLQLYLLVILQGAVPPLLPLLWVAALKLVELAIYVYIIALIAQAVLSWVNPQGYGHNPLASLLHSLNDPLLRPLQRIIPPVGMFDLSPLVAILLLNVALIVVRALY